MATAQPAALTGEGNDMENELREIEALTRELLVLLDGFWSPCRGGAPGSKRRLAEEMQNPDLSVNSS